MRLEASDPNHQHPSTPAPPQPTQHYLEYLIALDFGTLLTGFLGAQICGTFNGTAHPSFLSPNAVTMSNSLVPSLRHLLDALQPSTRQASGYLLHLS